MNQFQLGQRVERMIDFGDKKIRSYITGTIVVAWLEGDRPYYVIRADNAEKTLRICKHEELVDASPMQLELFPKEE